MHLFSNHAEILHIMRKKMRQEKVLELIRTKRFRTQAELVEELRRRGIRTTQSSVSRDLARLGVVKLNGYYTLPRLTHPVAGVLEILDLDTAGDHLIVVKTEPGQASPVALKIDGAHFPEVVGTVAGDDTVFIAVKDREAQRKAIARITQLLTWRQPARRGR
jgi:transcriptional regulator of arginine metabolism